MAHPFAVMTAETLSGARTITQAEADAYTIMTFDPGGSARDLTLPDPTANAGNFLLICNSADGAEVITIDDGTGDIATPTQAESVICFCDGVRWRAAVGAMS